MPLQTGHYGLVIGIDHYPNFRSLQGACKDAEDFYSWLLDPALGGVPEENAELVLSSQEPIRPIHDDIDEALERLLVKARGEDKRLYLYFSGHGLASSHQGVGLCLAKWSKRWRNAALDSQSYERLVMKCGYFSEVLCFYDCCRLLEVSTDPHGANIEYPVPGDRASHCRSFIGYATEFTNAAFEAEADRTIGDVRGHFTRALIKALNGDAAEPEGGVRASKLKDYLEVHTPMIASASNHIQEPEIINGFKAVDEPLIGHAKPAVPAAKATVRITFISVSSGEAVIIDGQLREVKRGDTAGDPWVIHNIGRTILMIRHLPSGQEKSVQVQGDETEEIHVQF
jgi:hypothetical protein